MYQQDLVLNNIQGLICHKPTNQSTNQTTTTTATTNNNDNDNNNPRNPLFARTLLSQRTENERLID